MSGPLSSPRFVFGSQPIIVSIHANGARRPRAVTSSTGCTCLHWSAQGVALALRAYSTRAKLPPKSSGAEARVILDAHARLTATQNCSVAVLHHSRCGSSTPSLSGRVGVKRFQTAPSRRSDVGCHSQGPRFSSGSALGPSHDGIRRMRRTNLPTRPCRKTYGRHKESKRTRLIHRPCGDIAPPVGGIRVFSCCVSIVHNSL